MYGSISSYLIELNLSDCQVELARTVQFLVCATRYCPWPIVIYYHDIYIKISSKIISLQTDLNYIYLWAINNNMLFNHQKFNYISFSSSMSSINTNVYYSPSLDIIKPSENVLDLGITMSRNCSFDVHINILCKKCTDLSGWILRTFTSRDSTTLMTLFNALILSRLDYCSQLWSPHLIRHINQIEKNSTFLY